MQTIKIMLAVENSLPGYDALKEFWSIPGRILARGLRLIKFIFSLLLLSALAHTPAFAQTATTAQPVHKAPAPLFRDPIFDGAADPVVVYNREKKQWWMFYTQR